MKSQLDADPGDLFHSVPMWMCPTCGRTVTLPFGTSTSLPERTICECAGRLGNDGKFYGHYTMMVGNAAGKRFDQQLEERRVKRRAEELAADERRWAAALERSRLWARVFLDLVEVDGWRPLAVPSGPHEEPPP